MEHGPVRSSPRGWHENDDGDVLDDGVVTHRSINTEIAVLVPEPGTVLPVSCVLPSSSSCHPYRSRS
jgi:hypothetical protein